VVALKTRKRFNTVYIRRFKTMNVPFEFDTVQKMTNETALLDSGATENFLDEDVWEQLQIGRIRLPVPLTVHNVDGTENCQGKIEFYSWLKIYYQGQMARMKFYLTSLEGDHFILGYPFLYAFNLEVDWREARLRGGLVQIETIGFCKVECQVEECQKEAHLRAGQMTPAREIWIWSSTVAQQWAREAHQNDKERTLLPEYQKHRNVFNEEKAKRFPPIRDGELDIPLMPEAPKVLDCKVYPLTREEQDLLQTFLTKEEQKGYIYLGSSPYTAPVFFIGKKDSDEKRIIMDYCKLNKWTV